MARRNRKRSHGTDSEQWIKHFKAEVMRREGYRVDPKNPDDVKYEVAKNVGVPLQQGDNGALPTEAAGKVGGRIGGPMVREMIRLAQEQLIKKQQQ